MIYNEKPTKEERRRIERARYSFFDIDERVEELLTQYKKHQAIIVAVDFDDTVYNYRGDKDFSPVHDLLRRCEKLGFKIVVYTVRNKRHSAFITEFYNDIDVKFDAINDHVVKLKDHPADDKSKIYYNVFLDDKAGLMEAFLILKEAVEIIEEGKENIKKQKEEEEKNNE